MHKELFLSKTIYFGYHCSLYPHIKFLGVIEPFNFTTSGTHHSVKVFLQVSTMGSKWHIESFSRDNNFGLWKWWYKKCIEAFKGEESIYASLIEVEKTKKVNKVRSVIILCLWDKVIRKVFKEKNPALMWEKLESLYMIKYFPCMMCLKQQLYSFKMVGNKSIEIDRIYQDRWWFREY